MSFFDTILNNVAHQLNVHADVARSLCSDQIRSVLSNPGVHLASELEATIEEWEDAIRKHLLERMKVQAAWDAARLRNLRRRYGPLVMLNHLPHGATL
jgi:hypothetical protein